MRKLILGFLLFSYTQTLSANKGQIQLHGEFQKEQTSTIIDAPDTSLIVSTDLTSDLIVITCNSLSGSGLIEGTRINILANLFEFTGTINCSELCRIEARDYKGIFLEEGTGKFEIIVIP